MKPISKKPKQLPLSHDPINKWRTDSDLLQWLIENSMKKAPFDDEIQLVIPEKVIQGNEKDFCKKVRLLILRQRRSEAVGLSGAEYRNGVRAVLETTS